MLESDPARATVNVTAGGHTVGIDIGGANIKLADSSGNCSSVAMPLWLEHLKLGARIGELLKRFGAVPQLAVTMTGELADCFATRREGVASILSQVATAYPVERTFVYSLDGRWLAPQQAIDDPWTVAASNWHVLACWIGSLSETTRAAPSILMVDIGSTTVDIVPVQASKPITLARTDRERMQLGQLVYTGFERTPIAAIVRNLDVSGSRTPVMAERFATSADAYLTLGLMAEEPDCLDTADGRPKTAEFARARLARMVGEDSETLSVASIQSLASQIIDAQASTIALAVNRNLEAYFSGPAAAPLIVGSGHGRPLLELVLQRIARKLPAVWLDHLLNPEAARCAPSLAAARLLDSDLSRSVREGPAR